MSESIPTEDVLVGSDSEELDPTPLLQKEVYLDLSKTLKEFTECSLKIEEAENTLQQQRARKAALLREHPWIGNIQGTLNKEAFKVAKASLHPPPEQAPAEAPSEALHEQKEIPVIQKKKKAVQKPSEDLEAKKARRRIEKKLIQKDTEIKKSKSQFLPGHPAHE